MVTVHRERYVCAKADAQKHPDRETAHDRARLHFYALSSLLTIRARLAARCPDVAAGRAREGLVIRDAEFTVNHRSVALRILLAACHSCPDPDPLEPIMHPDPDTAETVHAAAVAALARVRYYARNNAQLEQVMSEHDTALAQALGIAPEAVPELTATTPAPTEREAEFDRVLEASSVGPLPDDATARELNRSAAHYTLMGALNRLHRHGPDAAVAALAIMPVPVLTGVRRTLNDIATALTAAEQQRRTPRATT